MDHNLPAWLNTDAHEWGSGIDDITLAEELDLIDAIEDAPNEVQP
jgi:hypothetical protein